VYYSQGMKHFLAIMFFASALQAQLVVGVKGGLPFNDAMKLRSQVANRTVDTSTTPFVVGPVLELRLPFGIGAEFDMLWKRYKQTVGSEGITDSSWEFPLLAKYRFPGIGARLFVEAGITHQRLGSVLTSLRAVSRLDSAEVQSELRRGGVFGAGFEAGGRRTRFSLGGRYSRWQSTSLVPNSNFVDVLLGITF
jgi:hypothetical protein